MFYIKNKFVLFKFFVLFAPILLSCKTRNSLKETSAPSQIVEHDTRGSCVIPKTEEFKTQASEKIEEEILNAVLETEEFKKFKENISHLGAQQKKDYILKTIVPIQTNCDTYQKSGIGIYGKENFVNFARLAILASSKKGTEALEKKSTEASKSFKNIFSFSSSETLNLLRYINTTLAPEKKLNVFRSFGEDSLHSIPLRNDELLAMKEISKEGILKIITFNKPIKNAYGEMVTGEFLSYPDGSEVKALLEKMERDFLKSLNETENNEEAYVQATGSLVRQCISIHPFHDANGRSCLILGMYFLSKRNIPHSVVWAGEDVLLSKTEWLKRFLQGINYHKNLLQNTLN
jgi:prophage maintenance system killer protein